MKLNEFKTELNAYAYTTTDKISGTINVYSNKCWEEGKRDEWFLQLAPARDTVVLNKRWSNLDDMPPFNLRDLLNLIAKLEGTPVEERFPEKKYVLSAMRCAEGPVPVKQYVDAVNISTTNVEFHFGFANEKANAMKFTQEELGSLSDFFPKDAIDAMKEEVKDDE